MQKISKSLYDEIINLTSNGQLNEIRFQPWHKGLDISINGKFNNAEFSDFQDRMAEWWYENEFQNNQTFNPAIVNGKLYFKVWNDIDEVLYGSLNENWNFQELFNLISPHLFTILNSHSAPDDFWLSASITGSKSKAPTINEYSLEYYPEAGKSKSLTSNKNIKKIVVDYLHRWSLDYSNEQYSIEICQSELDLFTNYWQENIELEIVNE